MLANIEARRMASRYFDRRSGGARLHDGEWEGRDGGGRECGVLC